MLPILALLLFQVRVDHTELHLSSRVQLPSRSTDVVLLFDCSARFHRMLGTPALSGSVLGELENVRVSVYGFSDAVYRLIQPTDNVAELGKAIAALSRVPAVAATAKDPILQAMQDAMQIPGSRPKIMVIFSGAMSKACQMPKNRYQEVIRIANENGITLFPVAVEAADFGSLDASVSGHRAMRWPVSPGIVRDGMAGFLSMGPATGGQGLKRYTMPSAIVPEVVAMSGLK